MACVPDSVHGFSTVRQVYELAEDTAGKYSTPVLFDKETNTIVSNESLDIWRILDSAFQDHAKHPEVELLPGGETAEELDALNTELVYEGVNNAVYKCGFATKQKPYDDNFRLLFASLDTLEERLATRRFLGNTAQPTWLDIRLFHTLVRFDPVYVVYFKTNANPIASYPNLLGFMRDVYQWSEVRPHPHPNLYQWREVRPHPNPNLYQWSEVRPHP